MSDQKCKIKTVWMRLTNRWLKDPQKYKPVKIIINPALLGECDPLKPCDPIDFFDTITECAICKKKF